MRPLLHPSLDALRPEAILHALADPERAAIFAEIAGSECVQRCSVLADTGARVIPKSFRIGEMLLQVCSTGMTRLPLNRPFFMTLAPLDQQRQWFRPRD